MKVFFVLLIFNSFYLSAQFNTVKQPNMVKYLSTRNSFKTERKAPADDNKADLNVGLVGFSLPLDSIRYNSGCGIRFHPIKKRFTKHKGIDLYSNKSPVYAVIKGKIKKTGYEKGYGFYVILEHGPFEFLYAHLSHIYIKEGSTVEMDQIIGRTGSTGSSTGDHLHFEVIVNGSNQDPGIYFKNLLLLHQERS